MNDLNEGLEYAQMLEIPVSTVNVVKKRSLFKRNKPAADLKDSVVDSVNERLSAAETQGEQNAEPSFPQTGFVVAEDLTEPDYPVKEKKNKKFTAAGIVLACETAAACLLAAGIFLCNVFMEDTAINSFIGNITAVREEEAAYNTFTLTSPVSETSDAEITVSEDGVLHFTEKTSVYPVCDGEVATISETDGLYTIKIAHTSTFCSVVTGLDAVYASVGEEVKGNLPVGYSYGEAEVQVSMYNGDELLNCYKMTGAVPVWNS